ncbi:hypothetical protein IFM89_015345 [Coptis chinensis]|uniref:RRM domain-containing protein n=1 Tax=Coptis chinensis TaxID=261450 RepID=A0A835M604_9MAGN|nr:hypothetical protein IFM89_015345 [Coptis chinensis]
MDGGVQWIRTHDLELLLNIKELFSLIGELKRYTVHSDRNGCSSGSAEVIFTIRADALAAMKQYNNVQLDGKPMNPIQQCKRIDNAKEDAFEKIADCSNFFSGNSVRKRQYSGNSIRKDRQLI